MQQGRQECRPSDGPATLLSPMVATKACFAPPPPTLSRSAPDRIAPAHSIMKSNTFYSVLGGALLALLKLFLPVRAKTCFGGESPGKLDVSGRGVYSFVEDLSPERGVALLDRQARVVRPIAFSIRRPPLKKFRRTPNEESSAARCGVSPCPVFCRCSGAVRGRFPRQENADGRPRLYFK